MENEYAYGMMCHKHFDQRDPRPLKSECESCPACIEARKNERDRIQRDHTIDPSQPYGQHISLYCVNHPNLRWSTKNIDFIGARSIFYFGREPECSCSISDLEVVKV